MVNEWEKVPGDLLRKIEERLLWYVDKVRFYCVCKSWQSELPDHPQVPLPLLLLPSNNLDGGSHGFFNLADNKTYYLDLRKLHGIGSHRFRGSSHGWVFTYDEVSRFVFMFNPLTGLHKPLPSRFNSPKYIRKCVVSSNPSLSDDYIVVALPCFFQRLAYTMCGDDKWNFVDNSKDLIDIIFYEERLYGLTRHAQLMLIEIGSPNPLVQISTPASARKLNAADYTKLVSSRAGLLMVQRIAVHVAEERKDHKTIITYKTIGFNVYKFDFGVGRWSSSFTDIGDDILFVGTNYSDYELDKSIISCPAGAGLSKDCPKGNTIYFLDNFRITSDNRTRILTGLEIQREYIQMKVFDLKTKQIEELSAFEYSTEAIPLKPIWFTPTL